ncbi:glutathione S-transferase C-terminal domain-containing protein [Sphingomonas sp.]|uniref:glutathione S-transferase C-terminal domain-containing protein n=1 Tax=Sphingomonas sp. TaxID=28214 RepID=UPI003CC5F86B
MKLYYSPGACSLADHVALHEAGFGFEIERVDLKTKLTEHGADYRAVNSKGYVPALTLDSGEHLSENVAILDWIADQRPALRPTGPLGRTRLLEMMSYISGELHKAYGPLFRGASDEDKAAAKAQVAAKLAFVASQLKGAYLFGSEPGVADFFLFPMIRWAAAMGIDTPPALTALQARLAARPAVQQAMAEEGLS